MEKFLCTELLRGVFLTSAGIFAGMGTTLNLVSVPALLPSKDPVPTWRVTYNRGKNIAFTCIITSVGTAITLYFRTQDVRYLVSALLTFVIGPYTGFFMLKTNDRLHALKDQRPDEREKEAKELAVKWGKLQWGRTLLSFAAFTFGLYTVISTK